MDKSEDKDITKDWRSGGNPNAHKDWKDGGDWRWGGKWSNEKFTKQTKLSYKPKDWRKPI